MACRRFFEMERILKLTKNARLELTVESFGAEGEGVCRYEGMAVFVPRALPGERIIAQITRVEKRYAFARAMEILSASPDRVTPACPYARQCGGCTCQHMAYGAQLAFKRSQVEGCMRHIAGLSVPCSPCLACRSPGITATKLPCRYRARRKIRCWAITRRAAIVWWMCSAA